MEICVYALPWIKQSSVAIGEKYSRFNVVFHACGGRTEAYWPHATLWHMLLYGEHRERSNNNTRPLFAGATSTKVITLSLQVTQQSYNKRSGGITAGTHSPRNAGLLYISFCCTCRCSAPRLLILQTMLRPHVSTKFGIAINKILTFVSTKPVGRPFRMT